MYAKGNFISCLEKYASFLFCRYIHFREKPTKDEFDMFSLRSNSIYTHFVRIRYGYVPSFARFCVYRKSISSALAPYRVLFTKHIE